MAITPLLPPLEPALAYTPVPPELEEVAVIDPAPSPPLTVALPRMRAVPFTSSVAVGAVVAMPTLPEPSKMFELPSLVGLSHFVIWLAVPVPVIAEEGWLTLLPVVELVAEAFTKAEGGRPPMVS